MTPDTSGDREDAALPGYAIRLSPAATATAVFEYDRLTTTAGVKVAEEWREGLLASWAGLATLPLRCPLAQENTTWQAFRPGPPLRVFLYRSGRRNVWRILFTAHEETADDPPIVQVHQIRHAAQAPLTDWPTEDAELL